MTFMMFEIISTNFYEILIDFHNILLIFWLKFDFSF